MPKEPLLEMSGVVSDVLPHTMCRVTLDNGVAITAHAAGGRHIRGIRIGDRVMVEISPGDFSVGRISSQERDACVAPPLFLRPLFQGG
jgi:translation initiation factor IF-1